MKLNLKNETLMKLSLGCIALLAAASIAADVMNYIDVEQKLSRSYRDLQLSEKMAEASQLNLLIRDVNGTQMAEAKKLLNWKLAHDLFAISSMTADASAKEKYAANYVIGHIVSDEKAHPDYYLAAVPVKRLNRQ
jgi:hypothetical protein